MIVPPFLKPGDKISVVAPARKVRRDEIESAIKILEDWQLVPVLGSHLWKEQDQFSANDYERKEDLQKAMDDPEIKAIICARGGYGSVRIIDDLDFSYFNKKPKWLIGFSDITVLHSHVLQNSGIATLHSPMLINFQNIIPEALLRLRNYLFGDVSSINIQPHHLNKKGIAKGVICGGNLSVLYSLLGSASDIETSGKILFLEDLDEYLYHIDRMLMALKRAGKLRNVKGVIIGAMTDMKDNAIPFGKTAEEIISEYFIEKNIPVAYNFPAGHFENNNPVFFGKEAKLYVQEKVVLNYI